MLILAMLKEHLWNGSEKRSLTLPNTKAWCTDWKTIEVKISLRSGANRIRLTTLEKGGMLIDELSIK